MKLTGSFITKSLGLPDLAAAIEFQQISTDSREVKPGDVFLPLKGEKFDGHDFIPQVIQKGVRAIFTQQKMAPVIGVHFFQVPDTIEAYRTLASAWLKLSKAPLVLVAGSVGKTTTKELLAAFLEGKFAGKVLKTQDSENGFVGIPKTLLKLRAHHAAVVLEVGIDAIGAMEQHLRLVSPKTAIVTAIEAEHLEFLKDIDTVASEECVALFETHRKQGLVALNWDDEWVQKLMRPLPDNDQSTAFSIEKKPPRKNWVYGKVVENKIQIESSHFGSALFTLPLPGLHNARNFVAAYTLAKQLGLSDSEITLGMATFKAVDGRSQLKTIEQGPLATLNIEVLCDYYNASPASTKAGIALLKDLAAKKNTQSWACLADMLELGANEEAFHRELAAPLLDAGIDHVLLFGKRMRWLASELKTIGFAGEVKHFENKEALSSYLTQNLAKNSSVLLKGSRSMRMEEVWQLLQRPIL